MMYDLLYRPRPLADAQLQRQFESQGAKNLYQYEVDRIDIFSKILDRVLEKTPTSILDIACGAGDTLARLRTERNFSGLLVGIDLSPGMIATAENRTLRTLSLSSTLSHMRLHSPLRTTPSMP